MTPNALLLSSVFAPFIASLFAPLLARILRARAGLILILAFLPALLLSRYMPSVETGEALEASLTWVPSLGLNLSLRADGFSLLFALIIAGIGALILAYASAYLGPREKHGRFFCYLLIFGGAMLGLVLADNLIALFAFWELTSIASFLLIGFWDSRAASQDGAIKALIITAIGGLALLVAVALLVVASGTVNLSELDADILKEHGLFSAIAILLMLAAFTKSAQLPFHLWLPTAMEAPTPVSAYLHSATMVKAGVVLVAKFGFLLGHTSFGSVIMYFGLCTMFWGSYLALRQNDLKALLAYSTVSQLGLLMSLYGAGMPFPATAHLINHAAFKASLFMVVGIIDHETGSRDISKLSGLARKLPITFALAIPATLSMAGLPPLGGFLSKELFYETMLHQGWLPMTIAVTGSMMTFAYCLRFLSVFLGSFSAPKPHVHEAPLALWLPILPLSLATIGLGTLEFNGNVLWVPWVERFTELSAESLGYHSEHLHLWHGFTTVLWLSLLTWAVGILIHLGRNRFVAVQDTLTPSWNANTVFYSCLRGSEQFANWVTVITQRATFATHVRFIWLFIVLIGFFCALQYVTYIQLPALTFLTDPVLWGITLLILIGCFGVLRARSRLTAIIYLGLAGTGTVLTFVFLSAPDLALTQLLIETVSVILFLSVFRYLPHLTRYGTSNVVRTFNALLAFGVGATVTLMLLLVNIPITERIQDYFVEYSKVLGGGNNIVNVILVDFRGYDTMGEITVLAIVSVAVYALLRLRPGYRKSANSSEEDSHE